MAKRNEAKMNDKKVENLTVNEVKATIRMLSLTILLLLFVYFVTGIRDTNFRHINLGIINFPYYQIILLLGVIGLIIINIIKLTFLRNGEIVNYLFNSLFVEKIIVNSLFLGSIIIWSIFVFIDIFFL